MAQQTSEYVLTLVQHTYCSDCASIKNKIAEVYIMSGLPRGEESRHWRLQILSPPFDREARRDAFPAGFKNVDVPALKMEVNGRTAAVTQVPGTISAILNRLKEMLREHRSNAEMASEIARLAKTAGQRADEVVCDVDGRTEVSSRVIA